MMNAMDSTTRDIGPRPPWFWLGLLWCLTLLLGFHGAWNYGPLRQQADGVVVRFFDALYMDLQLVTLNAVFLQGGSDLGWSLQVARLSAPALAALTVFQTLKLILDEQWQDRKLRYIKDHHIICGLGHKGYLLATRFANQGEKVVVIDQNPDNEYREDFKKQGMFVLIGDATQRHHLRRAGIATAQSLISVCGDDNTNLEIAVQASEEIYGRSVGNLRCLVHMNDSKLCHLLSEVPLRLSKPGISVDFFNIYDRAAVTLLSVADAVVERKADYSVDDLIVGSSSLLGQSLVTHLANYLEHHEQPSQAGRVTLIDHDAGARVRSLNRRYTKGGNWFSAINWDFGSSRDLGEVLADCRYRRVFVVIDDESLALSLALQIRTLLPDRAEDQSLIFVKYQGDLLKRIGRAEVAVASFKGIDTFSPLERTMEPDLLLGTNQEKLARTIHQRYLSERRRDGAVDHPSMVPWELLPEDIKESNRQQASHMSIKVSLVHREILSRPSRRDELVWLRHDEVEKLAEHEHARYVEERKAAGWTYGPVRDNVKKQNPTLVPWAILDEGEKDKDRQAVRLIPVLLAMVGLRLSEPSLDSEPIPVEKFAAQAPAHALKKPSIEKVP